MNSDNDSTVVVFDIRKFSEHRYHLGLISGGGSLLTQLVSDLLKAAVEIVTSEQNGLDKKETHALNHTGDGFVLIVRGRYSPLIALSLISEFRDFVSLRLKTYEAERAKDFPNVPIGNLDFGIGADYGWVGEFDFKDFKGKRKGYLGTAINIASRVEQCTKDHIVNVICTKKLKQRALECNENCNHKEIKHFFRSLGAHRLRGFPKAITLYEFKRGFHLCVFSRKPNG